MLFPESVPKTVETSKNFSHQGNVFDFCLVFVKFWFSHTRVSISFFLSTYFSGDAPDNRSALRGIVEGVEMSQSAVHLSVPMEEYPPNLQRKFSLQLLRTLLPRRSSSRNASIVSCRSSITGEASEQRPFVVNVEDGPNKDPFYLFQVRPW